MSLMKQVDPSTFRWASQDGPAAEVRRITGAADAADNCSNLNEQAVLQLKNHGLQHARLWVGDGGFALLRDTVLDLAVHPDARGNGVGTSLAGAALARIDQVEAWSHCDHPAAARIADRFGIPRARELRIMRRSTTLPVSDVVVPEGIEIRTFRPEDQAALLEVNAAAFAHHPDQGQMDSVNFGERTAEGWFDPEGLFVAVPADSSDSEPALLGFHWTKVHRETDPPYGEVYVVAVSPEAGGRGLGTALTNVGLRHLAQLGLAEVILYVDGDNEPAIAVYANQGFELARTEVQYRGPTAH